MKHFYIIGLSLIFSLGSNDLYSDVPEVPLEEVEAIEARVNSMSVGELEERKSDLESEKSNLEDQQTETQSPSQNKAIGERLNIINAELTAIQKALIAVAAGVTVSELTEDDFVDTVPPVITLNGNPFPIVELGSTYTDAGATANDAYRGSTAVSSSGTVDPSTVGVYIITYTATDLDNNTATATRTVTVVDTTDPVVVVTGDNPATTELGLTYTDAGATATDASGNVTVVTTGTVDSDAVGSYTLTYTATDASGNSGTATRTVNVVDTNNNAPVITSLASFDMSETRAEPKLVGTVTATDVDFDGSVTLEYRISGTELTIGLTSGILELVNAPDYETKDTYTATVTVTDGGNETTQDITVNILDENDNAPVITSLASFDMSETRAEPKLVGTVTATDVDFDGSVTLEYRISGTELTIGLTSGILELVNAPDYETKDTYTATVTVTDGGNETTQDITVNILDENDNAPVITSSSTFLADENQTSIGTVVATDVDFNGSVVLEYRISGSEILIGLTSGELTFVTAPDYETKDTYTATVTVTDGGNETTQDITVNVNDVGGIDDDPATGTGTGTGTGTSTSTGTGTGTST